MDQERDTIPAPADGTYPPAEAFLLPNTLSEWLVQELSRLHTRHAKTVAVCARCGVAALLGRAACEACGNYLAQQGEVPK